MWFAVPPDCGVQSSEEVYVEQTQMREDKERGHSADDDEGNKRRKFGSAEDGAKEWRGVFEHKQAGGAQETHGREGEGESRKQTGENGMRSHDMSPLVVGILYIWVDSRKCQ